MTSTSSTNRPVNRNGFSIAIICALRTESDAVEALVDEFWEGDGSHYGKVVGDPNSYKLGRMGTHNVVIAYLPGMGNTNSASAAASFRASFPNVQLGLVVGICGGVPRSAATGKDIFLGDVVVSTGIVQHDFGWQYPDQMARKNTPYDSLGRPSPEIRAFLNQMQGWHARRQVQQNISTYLQQILDTKGFEDWTCPRPSDDRLFQSTYRHKHQDPQTCNDCTQCLQPDDPVCNAALVSSCKELGCSNDHVIARTNTNEEAVVHFGRIASSNQVMKSGIHRDMIASVEQVIGFEMEGVGVWDTFPTIVIKGVVDYADSHKNDVWHKFGAMVSAACAKAFLQEWRSSDQFMSDPLQESRQGRTAALNTSFVTYGNVKNMANEQHIAGDFNIQ